MKCNFLHPYINLLVSSLTFMEKQCTFLHPYINLLVSSLTFMEKHDTVMLMQSS